MKRQTQCVRPFSEKLYKYLCQSLKIFIFSLAFSSQLIRFLRFRFSLIYQQRRRHIIVKRVFVFLFSLKFIFRSLLY